MFNLLKKFFATPCLVSLLVGCGKEIIHSNDDSNNVTNREALTKSDISFKISYDASSQDSGQSSYQIENTGWLKIPAKPAITKGSARVVNSKIHINIPEQTPAAPSAYIYCEYSSIKTNNKDLGADAYGYTHYFKGCKEDIDLDGIPEEMNYYPGDTLALDEERFISLEIESSQSDDILEFQSNIEVDWH